MAHRPKTHKPTLKAVPLPTHDSQHTPPFEAFGHTVDRIAHVQQLQRTIGNKATRHRVTPHDTPVIKQSNRPTSAAIQRSIFSDAQPVLEGKYIKGLSYQFPTGETEAAAETFWKTHIKKEPIEIINQMLVGMDALLMDEALDIKIQLLNANSMEVVIQTQPKQKPHTGRNHRLSLSRLFTVQDAKLSVKESRTDVEGGLGKQLYRNLLPLYDSLGIEEITLEATETGKYAWARYGFLPKDDAQWQKITSSIYRDLKPALEHSLRQELTAQLGAVTPTLTSDINGVLGQVLTPENLRDIASEMDAPAAESNLNAIFNELVMEIVNDCLEEYFEEHLESLNTAFGGENAHNESSSEEDDNESVGGEAFTALYMFHGNKIKQKVMNALDLTGLKQEILAPAKAQAEDPRAAVGTLSQEVFNSIDPNFVKYPENRVIPLELASEVVAVMTSPDPIALRHLIQIGQRNEITQKLIYLLMQKSDVWEGRLSLSGADRDWIEDYIKQAASSSSSSSVPYPSSSSSSGASSSI